MARGKRARSAARPEKRAMLADLDRGREEHAEALEALTDYPGILYRPRAKHCPMHVC